MTQDATAPVEGISNVEEPAFQPGAWRLWGLAVVFAAALLALYLAQMLVDWAAVASIFSEARSLAGFIALWHGHSHNEALRELADNPVRIFLGTAVRSIATVGTIYGLRGLLPARSMRAFGFVKPTGEQLFFGFGYSAVALFGAAAAQIVLSPFIGRHTGVWIHIVATHHGFFAYVLDMLGGCVATPLAEETLFRGLLFTGLVQRMGPVPAALISSVLFGLFHLQPYELPHLIVAGLVMAYVYYHTRNIWAAMVTHATLNGIGFTLLYVIQLTRSAHLG